MGHFKVKVNNKEGDWWHSAPLGLRIAAGVGIGLLILAGVAAFGWVIMALWNWLMPEIFGLPEINYWQGWGLLALSSILFKGWGGDGDARYERRRKKSLKNMIKDEFHAEWEAEINKQSLQNPNTAQSGPEL